MAVQDTQYRINAPHVIQETIDGEVIIVNMESGNYYSINGAGATIWALLAQGYTPTRIAADLARAFDADGATIGADLERMLQELLAEALVVPGAPAAGGAGTVATAVPAARQPYEAPALHKYNDMQDLLLLDPVHDVDETGWPNISPEKV